jgi:putative exosortase-associated protein (TIGR04073 family)
MTLRIWGLLALLVIASPAGAQTAGRKFGRGLAGMTTAFLEVPGNIVAENRERGPAEGIPLGFAKGVGMIIPRVLVGVFELLSAPFAWPDNYQPILKPEFPWGYFEGGGSAPPPPSQRPRHR